MLSLRVVWSRLSFTVFERLLWACPLEDSLASEPTFSCRALELERLLEIDLLLETDRLLEPRFLELRSLELPVDLSRCKDVGSVSAVERCEVSARATLGRRPFFRSNTGLLLFRWRDREALLATEAEASSRWGDE